MCPAALLYEQLFRGPLGTASPIVLSCMLQGRSWVASARQRVAGLSQTVPSWGHGVLLHTGEFSSWLANSGFVKLFSFASCEIKKKPHLFELWRSGCPGALGAQWGTVVVKAVWSKGEVEPGTGAVLKTHHSQPQLWWVQQLFGLQGQWWGWLYCSLKY